MRSAGSGARPFEGAGGGGRVFLRLRGLVTPAAERRDEFPPRGDGGPECRTPAHRSRDGERSAGARAGGRAGARTGRPRLSPFAFLPPARARELPTRRGSPGPAVTGGLRGGPGSPADRGPSLLPLNLSAGRGAGWSPALEGLGGRRLQPSCWRGRVAKNKTIFLGAHSHLLRPAPSAVSTGACLGLVVQTPLSRFAQMCLCGNTALERSSDLCSNRSRDFSALLVTQFCNVF